MIADGSNADDRGDYRPGRQAAREFGVRSPLDEVGLTKQEIRELSSEPACPTWDEPASACLSSRIPYHSEVTAEKLRVIERAEAAVRAMGFRVCRVGTISAARWPSRPRWPARDRPRRVAARARAEISADRARAARHRLSARHHRSAGLSDGQPQRGSLIFSLGNLHNPKPAPSRYVSNRRIEDVENRVRHVEDRHSLTADPSDASSTRLSNERGSAGDCR